MAQKLGEAYIEVNADMSKLGPQLKLATNQVNSSLGVMKTNFMSAEKLSKRLFTVAKMGALAAGAAMLLASKQGQHLGDAFGALNQAVVDLTIGPALEKIAHAVELLAKNMSQLGFLKGFEKTFSTKTEITIMAIAGAIMGALVPALWSTVTATWAAVGGFTGLATAVWAALAPLLPFILAGAAIVATAYAIWKYWDQIVAFLSTSWNWLWTNAVSIFNGIVDAITSAWNWIVETTTSVWNSIVSGISSAWDWLVNTTTSIWNGIVNFFKEWGLTLLVVFGGPIGWLLAIIIHNWDAIKNWTINAWNAIVSFLSSVWEGIKSVAQAIWNPIANFFSKLWNGIKSVASSVWNGIKSVAVSVWNSIASFLTAVWNRIKSAATPFFNGIKNAITSVWNSLKSGTSSIWNSIKSAIGGAWDWIKDKATSAWSGIYNTIAGWVKKAASAMRPLISVANKAITGINHLTGSKLPTIPMPGLAKGGIVTAPTMALVGEGRYHEAVLPLSDKTFGALAEGITSRMNGGRGTVVNVYPQKAEIDEYDLANIMRRQQWAMGV